MSIEISTEQIKSLRAQTGLSVMQCKKALEEAGGDAEKALVILKKLSSEIALSKAERTLNAGTVASYIHNGAMVGSLVELFCETDFVSNNQEFKTLANDLAMHVAATNPTFLSKEAISEKEIETAKQVFMKEVEGKPDGLKEKIIAGKVDSYFADSILLEQPFIKNPELTIRQLIDSFVQKFGERIEVGRFARYSIK